MIESGTVSHNIEAGIGTITFSHPRANSLPGALLRSVASTIEELGSNPSARIIVVQSEGQKVFCSGASFDELQSVKTLEQSKNFFSGFAKFQLFDRVKDHEVLKRIFLPRHYFSFNQQYLYYQ